MKQQLPMLARSLMLLIVFSALPLRAVPPAPGLIDTVWPPGSSRIADLGRGIAIVFTPDLSVEGNCHFYQALGFACFDDPDWSQVIDRIRAFNRRHAERPIETVLLETHGTNGNGLKLQRGKGHDDDRSYIAVAALEEALEPAGVRHIIISACNSRRLLRPGIYRKLNRRSRDPLFLPATRGIIDASESFDPDRSRITVLTPARSQIETTLIGSIQELAPSTRSALEAAADARCIDLPPRFAISEMLIRILTRAPDLDLRTGVYVEHLSAAQSSPEMSERLFRSFVAYLDEVARRN